MKIWKHLTFVAVLAVLGIIVAFSGCDNGNGNETGIDPKCDCTETVHTDAECKCDAVGYDCTCVYEPVNNDPVLCTCVEKAHLEAGELCDCGGTDCNCTEKETPTARSEGTYRTLAFINEEGTPLEGTFSVTIKSNDQYLNAEWNATVDKVITALEATYKSGNTPTQTRFKNIFGDGVSIILINDLTNNWEVRDNEFRTLYLKTSSIDTADYNTAAAAMNVGYSNVGKSMPMNISNKKFIV